MKTEDDRFKMKIGARLNFAYTYGFLTGTSDYSSFDILRAKLYLGGNAFSEDLQYFLQAAIGENTRPLALLPTNETSREPFALEDFYVRVSKNTFNAKLGQFKVPLGRQWMIYSGNLQFVDRSIVSRYFLLGRDRGITLNSDKDTLSLSVGVFNGGGTASDQSGLLPSNFSSNGQNVSNDTTPGNGHLFLARLVAIPLGPAGYSEGDVEMSEGTRFEWGTTFVFDQDRDVDLNGDTVLDDANTDVYHFHSDLSWKHLGTSFVGEFYYRMLKSTLIGNQSAYGFYVQGGYMLIPNQTEIAARFSWLDPNIDLSSDRILETSGVLNLYIFSDHRYKVQTQYTWRAFEQIGNSNKNDHVVDVAFQITI